MNQAIEQFESDLKAENYKPKPFDKIDLLGISEEQLEENLKDSEKREQEAIEAARLDRKKALKGRIPDEFLRPIDRNNRNVDWNAFEKIQSWDGKQGIVARGMSGLGKTLAICQLLAREHVEKERDFLIVDEDDLLTSVSDAQMSSSLGKLKHRWATVDILFFDDIDKVNFSRGQTGYNAQTMVFGAIKKRNANFKPTILAYNLSLDEIFSGVKHTEKSLERRMLDSERWMNVQFDRVRGGRK